MKHLTGFLRWITVCFVASFFLLPGTAHAITFPETWRSPSHRTESIGNNFALSTTDTYASSVGARILRRGGNAVDAAVAVQFALAVTTPQAGNIGGGGFMVIHSLRNDTSTTLDFRETAPSASTREMYLDEDGNITGRSKTGHLASGVPGTVSGMWKAHRRFGTLPWKKLLQPAIRLAEDGIQVLPELHQAIQDARDRLKQFKGSRRKFLPDGKPLQPGDTFTQPHLAKTLRRIAHRGPDGFYRGKNANALVQEMDRGGGIISHKDLESYGAIWRSPVTFTYRDYRILSMGPPSSGGVTMTIMANILEGFDLASSGWHTSRTVHLVVEAMKRAFADRNRYLGDPDFETMPLSRLLSQDYARRHRTEINPNRATPAPAVEPGAEDTVPSGHTTHFSAVDSNGLAVSVTTTLNSYFGNGVTVRKAGFVLNNEMNDFTVKPGEPNQFGLVQGRRNAIEPGKRMLSSMSPTVVLDPSNELCLVTGSPGGPTIITTVFQTISNVVDHGMSLSRSVSSPRFHHQNRPDHILYEPGGFASNTVKSLRNMGHELVEHERLYGDVNAVMRLQTGKLKAVSDPRQPGRPIAE